MSSPESPAPPEQSAAPRLRAVYLAVVAVGVFLLPAWWMVGLAAAAQGALWFAVGHGAGRLLRQVRKLSLFLGVIFLAYALVSIDPATDTWREVSVLGLFSVEVNTAGALLGLAMVLRVLAVVLASQVARAGDPRALALGLRRLGVPRSAALSIDATLALLGERGRGGGGGGGGGKGRGAGKRGGVGDFLAALKRVARGDVGVIAERLRHHVARVEQHLEGAEEEGGERPASARLRRDIAVVAGIALTMLGVKMLKLVPGLPFAPGHKGVLLIPLYIAAGLMTRSRFGATLAGVTMGTVAFLLGDGRYGVFEIAKHITPGLIVDLLMPVLRGRRSVLVWALVGLVVALGRFATVVVVALAVQAPAVVYAFLVPGLLLHGTFGVLSGAVTAPLLRSLRQSDDNGDSIPSEAPGDARGAGRQHEQARQ